MASDTAAQGHGGLDLPAATTHEAKLWALSKAAVAINSQRSVEQMLDVITEQARSIIGAHLASTSLTHEGTGAAEGWPQRNIVVSLSPRYAAWESYDRPSRGSAWYGLVCADNQVVRMTAAELEAHPLWRDFGEERDHHPPMRGWLAAPLVASDGRNLGLLQLSDRYEGDFLEADEAILVQLAQLASIAVEKAQLLQQRDRQAEHLRGLAEAAVAISSPLGIERILERITEVAVELIGAHQAVTSLTEGRPWDQVIQHTYLSDKYAAWRDYATSPDGSGIYARACEHGEPMRLTQEELEAHPHWRGFGEHADSHPPMRGWLAVPLRTAKGENLGLIQLSDRLEGEFTEQDEALLVQLAQLASVAIENAQLQQELVAREREQLTQDLLTGLSHDMQTPLAVILGASRLLHAELATSDGNGTKLTSLLQTQSARLYRLIQQLLDYMRLEAGDGLAVRRQRVPITPLLDELVQLFEHQRPVEVDVASPLADADTDADRLVQVLANLVGNAIKFSDDVIVVEARSVEGGVAIDVVDRGPGIDPAQLDAVFAKFYRGEDAQRTGAPGHGLGLYVSKALMETMGGSLTVTSTPGVGSRFRTWIPAHADR